jgi:VanZ family protein
VGGRPFVIFARTCRCVSGPARRIGAPNPPSPKTRANGDGNQGGCSYGFDMFADDVWRYMPLGPVPSLVLAVVGIALLIYVTVVSSRESRILARAMLTVTVLIVLAYTGRGALSNDDGGFVWHVGESIKSEWNNINRSLGMVNIFGNIVMFVPIGWLVTVLAPRRRALAGIVAGIAFSGVIEVWQMLSGSYGDFDDLLLNAAGAAIGGACATLLMISRSKPLAVVDAAESALH